MAFALDGAFGYVVLAILLNVLLHQGYMAFGVTSARKRYGVNYPALYASESNKDGAKFNCVQRGHQNSLEWLASSYALTLLAGLQFPRLSAILCLVYMAGRVQYYRGYSTGVPKNRLQGSFMYIGSLGQLVLAVIGAFAILRS